MKKSGSFQLAFILALVALIGTLSCGGGGTSNGNASVSVEENGSAKTADVGTKENANKEIASALPASNKPTNNPISEAPDSHKHAHDRHANADHQDERDPVQVQLEHEFISIFDPIKSEFDAVSFLNRYKFRFGDGEYEGETAMAGAERKAHGIGRISYDDGTSLVTKLVHGNNSFPSLSIYSDSKKNLVCVGNFQEFKPVETLICLQDGKYRRTK